MYEAHFGLADQPFHIAPDLRFHVDTAPQRAAVAILMHGLGRGDEFMLLEGDFGVGKTTAGRWLLAHLDPARYAVGELSGLRLEGDPLLKRIADAFGLDDFDIVRPLGTLVQFFESFARSGREAVLMIDEAHCLGVDALRRLKKLTAVTVAGHRALHVLLVGRAAPVEGLAELDRIGRPLRLGARAALGPLDASTTNAFILSRLHRAGWNGHPSVESGATAAVHACTDGNPGRINRLCGHILLQLYMHGRDVMTVDLVRSVDEQLKAEWDGDTQLSSMPMPVPMPAPRVAAAPAPASATSSVPVPAPAPIARPAAPPVVSEFAQEVAPPRPAANAAVLAFDALERTDVPQAWSVVPSSPSLALVASSSYLPPPWTSAAARRRRTLQAAAAVVLLAGAGVLWKGLGGPSSAPVATAAAAPAAPAAPTASALLTPATLADAAVLTLAESPTAAARPVAPATPPASNAAPAPAIAHPAEPARLTTAGERPRRRWRTRTPGEIAAAVPPSCTLEAQAMGLCRHAPTPRAAPSDEIRESTTPIPREAAAPVVREAPARSACDASRTALGLCPEH